MLTHSQNRTARFIQRKNLIAKVRKQILIILCTGYSERVSAEKAKEVDIREFFMKAIMKKELVETIREVRSVH